MNNKKKYSKAPNPLILGIFILLLLISVLLGYVTSYIAARFSALEMVLSVISPTIMVPESNILLLGIDNTPGIKRSDTIMVLHVDPNNSRVELISIPRDTMVVIPGIGLDKVNHAFAYGGAELSARTISNFLNVPVPNYIVVNVPDLRTIIDKIGGITINVEKRMYYVDYAGGLFVDLYPGLQKLNGRNAIAYLRFRKDGGDFYRIARQQKFLMALGKEIISKENIIKAPFFARELFSYIKTNMDTKDILNIASVLRDSYENNRVKTYTVSGTGTMINKVYYLRPDLELLQQITAKVFQHKTFTEENL